jgi:hypothetical protein
MDYDLGYFGRPNMQAGAAPQPFRAETVTYVSGIKCNLCVRNGPKR